jgi:hypothetical protein
LRSFTPISASAFMQGAVVAALLLGAMIDHLQGSHAEVPVDPIGFHSRRP